MNFKLPNFLVQKWKCFPKITFEHDKFQMFFFENVFLSRNGPRDLPLNRTRFQRVLEQAIQGQQLGSPALLEGVKLQLQMQDTRHAMIFHFHHGNMNIHYTLEDYPFRKENDRNQTSIIMFQPFIFRGVIQLPSALD